MKFVLLLCVALLGLGCLTVKAQEFPDPITIEFGEEVSGDGLRNLYYGESVATATPSDHTVTIVWDDLLINRIRVYAYAVRRLGSKWRWHDNNEIFCLRLISRKTRNSITLVFPATVELSLLLRAMCWNWKWALTCTDFRKLIKVNRHPPCSKQILFICVITFLLSMGFVLSGRQSDNQLTWIW